MSYGSIYKSTWFGEIGKVSWMGYIPPEVKANMAFTPRPQSEHERKFQSEETKAERKFRIAKEKFPNIVKNL